MAAAILNWPCARRKPCYRLPIDNDLWEDGMTTARVMNISSKLIVDDEEKMAAFYSATFGMHINQRVSGKGNGTGEVFREVILTIGQDMASGTLVMFKYADRPAPRDQQVTLVLLVEDILKAEQAVVENGGSLVAPIEDMPDHGVKVLFARDPEGAFLEIVELLPH